MKSNIKKQTNSVVSEVTTIEYPKGMIGIKEAKELTEYLGGSLCNRINFLLELTGARMPFNKDRTISDHISTYICICGSVMKSYLHNPYSDRFTIVDNNNVPYLENVDVTYTEVEIQQIKKRIKDIPSTVEYFTDVELEYIGIKKEN